MRAHHVLLVFFVFLWALPAWAEEARSVYSEPPSSPSDPVTLTLFPESAPRQGKTIRVIAQLARGGQPLTAEQLKTTHMQKFHLLIVDPTLTDYQHLHPEPTTTPGSYRFDFTPKHSSGYRAWADITPLDGAQLFVAGDLGKPGAADIDTSVSYTAVVNGYHFSLWFDKTPMMGEKTIGSIHITDDEGRAVASLEPVMGASAHIVGFHENYQIVLHTHPLANPPPDSGAMLAFHLAPVQPGFVRLFVQVRIDGEDIYAPFGIRVHDALPE